MRAQADQSVPERAGHRSLAGVLPGGNPDEIRVPNDSIVAIMLAWYPFHLYALGFIF